jgi:hydrogenase expression/formation protein HypD
VKFIDEFRDGKLARGLAAAIRQSARDDREYHFMEFCGGHTHAISRYGVTDLLPSNVRMIHGPGCPVCVLPIGRIDMAIRLARDAGVILCSYGDTLRVPASGGLSLLKAKAGLGCRSASHGERRGEIRMIYSGRTRWSPRSRTPIGRWSSSPSVSKPRRHRRRCVIKQAQALGLRNFSVLCCHVLTPSAIASILESPEVRQWGSVRLDGFIGPAHVSTIIGTRPYEFFAEEYRKPVVIAGFEPLDVMQAILMLIRQVNAVGRGRERVFARRDARRQPQGAASGCRSLRTAPLVRLARTRRASLQRAAHPQGIRRLRRRAPLSIGYQAVADHPACECGAILRGVKRPQECRIFGSVCTPENPVGSCMVSSEGACAAHYSFGRFADAAAVQ